MTWADLHAPPTALCTRPPHPTRAPRRTRPRAPAPPAHGPRPTHPRRPKRPPPTSPARAHPRAHPPPHHPTRRARPFPNRHAPHGAPTHPCTAMGAAHRTLARGRLWVRPVGAGAWVWIAAAPPVCGWGVHVWVVRRARVRGRARARPPHNRCGFAQTPGDRVSCCAATTYTTGVFWGRVSAHFGRKTRFLARKPCGGGCGLVSCWYG